MNLDAMRDEWKALDAKIDLGLRVSLTTMRRNLAERRGPSLWRVLPGLVIGALVLLWLGSFAFEQRTALRFVLPAVLLGALVLGYSAATIVELVWWRAIDWADALTVAQQKLAAVRRLRIRVTQAVFMTAGLVWALAILVVAKACGIDLYATPLRVWLIANLVFGALAIPLVWLVMRWLAPLLDARGWLQSWRDDIAGRDLVTTEALLVELASFERESGR